MPLVEMCEVRVEVLLSEGRGSHAVVGYFDDIPTVEEFMAAHSAGRDSEESWILGLNAAAAIIVGRGMPVPVDTVPPNTAAVYEYPDGWVKVSRTCRWVSAMEADFRGNASDLEDLERRTAAAGEKWEKAKAFLVSHGIDPVFLEESPF